MNAKQALEAAAQAVIDPQGPVVLAAMTRVTYLRRTPPEITARVTSLVPRARMRAAVVIPMYNYEAYVAEAIDSAATQEGVDVQVVIVDDCSTDASYEVAAQAASRYDNVQVMRNETNRGPGETFNRGWRAVEADIVQRLDPDDLLTPGSLARAAAVFEAAPRAGLVHGHFREFCGAPCAPQLGRPFGVVWSGRDWLRYCMVQDRNLVGTPAAVLRRDLMVEHGGWKPQLRHTQDFEMWLRAATVSDVGRVFDADQALRRVHGASLSTVEQVGTVNFDEHLLAYDEWYRDVGRELPDGAQLRDEARTALARRAMETARHGLRRGQPDAVAADQLVDLARLVDPRAPHQRQVAALRSAHALLGERVRLLPTSVAGAAAYRAAAVLSLARYRRTGL